MKYLKQINTENQTQTEISVFQSNSEVSEYHVMITGISPERTYKEQLNALFDTYNSLLEDELKGAVSVFKRYFLSDAANQTDDLMSLIIDTSNCAVSVIEQPPLNGTKIALWACLQTYMDTRNYQHIWGTHSGNCASNVEYQTRLLFNEYIMQLTNQKCTLADHCIRTWLFVQNVDTNYAGVVKARNEVFFTQGLTENTHYIASTGIEGRNANPNILVQMDTYAVKGLLPEQIQYLHAPTHLNPTHEYGVSFERGTCVKYGDRRQVFISGTASINNKGEIVWAGDIRKQTDRMCENVEVLLKEAECTFDDLAQLIVYLRDSGDYVITRKFFEENFPRVPKVIVLAPVCRPGWLIEMECIAIKADVNPEYPNY